MSTSEKEAVLSAHPPASAETSGSAGMARAETLPPGSNGLPFLGETFPLLKDMFGFIHRKMVQHGTIFRTRVLFRPTVFLAGQKANETWIDERIIQREGS